MDPLASVQDAPQSPSPAAGLAESSPKATGLDLSQIDPKKGGKYSPNLFRFLRADELQARLARVYRDKDGVLWPGFQDEHYLIGARLMSVLCRGRHTQTFAHPIFRKLSEVQDFWAEYEKIGRCAVDKDHAMVFTGDDDRWAHDGDGRTCAWCMNCRQVQKVEEVVERRASWENVPMQQAASGQAVTAPSRSMRP